MTRRRESTLLGATEAVVSRTSRGERGSGTVLAVGTIAVALTATVGALAVCSALLAAHTARSSADLAALAAAGAWVDGSDPCLAARGITEAQGTELTACTVQGDGRVRVCTSSPVPLRLRGVTPERAHGEAMAGPEALDAGWVARRANTLSRP